ncbi:MAG TPA: RNA polymerase sigma factor [Pirellulales bacterium]|nr:RNA polymerase sigma factor [Pirellulales bacterium]
MKVNPLEPGSAAGGPVELASLSALFARFQSELLGALVCLTGNLEDARDALQETFLKCWRHQDRLVEIENVKAWVFRIALNTGRDARSAAWRRRRQPLNGDATMLLANHAPPEAAMESAERLAELRSAIGRLRPEEQEVFLLRQNAGLSYDEIALAIGIPLGTVKTRMRMALANLRAVVRNDK